jgi:hypothetical protein
MEKIHSKLDSGLREQEAISNLKKEWIHPHVTEIPKFSILGGSEAGKAEGGTLDGSA